MNFRSLPRGVTCNEGPPATRGHLPRGATCHEGPPASRGHLPRGATLAPNRRWPLVAGTNVLHVMCHERREQQFAHTALKPGVHTNDIAPIYGRRAKKLGHASLATVFRHGRFTFQPILWENLESPVLRYQPITTAVITDACLNTRWHHGAYTSYKEDTRWLH